jgi:CitMHS family citrate-Mg2+:H+ or citrate-Ca2+:H+ symporter
MLAVLGFVTILLVLALIMSKKVSTLVALIFVPAITGFIAAFINAPNVIIQAAQAAAEKAGTAYVEPVITFGTRFTKALSILSADYMGKGLSSIVATGVMFIFAILFFSTCSDAGVFDPIINRILKFTGEDPVKVCIGTFLIGCICHLDGSGATTRLYAPVPEAENEPLGRGYHRGAGRRHHECYALGRPHSPCSRSHVWPGL